MSPGAPFPASHVERQFWLLQALAPEGRAYHVGSVFRLRGALDVRALRGAFEDLVARHAALRTTFEARGDEVLCVPRDEAPFHLEETSGPALPAAGEIDAELQRPFDLARGPLLRVRLWRSGDDAVLAWTMHHIVCDLATKELLSAELSERYAARRAGRAPAAPPVEPEARHGAHAAWERRWLASDAARAAEAYFARYLGDEVPPLALPEARPRPAVQSPRGARVTFELGPSLTERVERVARELRTKPFLVLLTAYAAWLARHTGEPRVAVGVPFSNRRREASQAAVGCFVNTLPVIVDLGGDPTFPEALTRLRAAFLGHHRHQELPLARVVARAGPRRDPARNPLYQAGFTFEPPMTLALDGLEVRSEKVHAGGAQLDVFLTMWRGARAFEGQLEYCSDLFEAPAVERWVRRYRALLDALLAPGAAGQVSVTRAAMLDAEEREQVLRTWNATDVAYDGAERLDGWLLRQAARSPDAPALRMGREVWTYRALALRAGALAEALRARGVRPGDRVGVYMERSFEMVTAVLGTVLAGAAYVPLEPEYPAHRLRLMLEDARPACILVQEHLARGLDAGGAPVHPVRLDAPGGSLDLRERAGDPADPAYVIFTSGSTGRPKGVVNGHRGIVNRLRWMQDAFRLDGSDVALQKTPFGFDVSVWEFFWPLCVGAQLEIAPPGVHRDPGALAALVRAAGVTVIHFVPSMLRAFLEHPDAARCGSLRRVVCSGEALGAELARRCCGILPAALDNLYGPTEAAVDVTWWPCRADLARDPVPIGRPIANTRLYVLDRHGEPAPIGVAGELHIGGVQVASGYVSRPELTQERFVPDPFGPGGGRLYRTGDLARWNPDGTLDFLGRIDGQVKVRGVRVELGEIEAVLEQHPAVRQCVVVARGGGAGEARLVAYVVARGPAVAPDPAAPLRAHLRERLPAAMVPDQLVLLPELPLTASGKVDRRALPEAAPAAHPAAPRAAPRDAVEAWLLDQLGELLGGVRPDPRENLFEAGASSITVAQLVARVRRRFDAEIPIARVFQHPTVEALAAAIAARGAGPLPSAGADPLAEARARAGRRRAQLSPPRRKG